MRNRFIPVPSAEFSDVLETALRRIVETQKLADWCNANSDHPEYERAAQARDRAIEHAGEIVGRLDDSRRVFSRY